MTERANPGLLALVDKGQKALRDYEIKVLPLEEKDFAVAFVQVRPSTDPQLLRRHQEWMKKPTPDLPPQRRLMPCRTTDSLLDKYPIVKTPRRGGVALTHHESCSTTLKLPQGVGRQRVACIEIRETAHDHTR